MGQTLKLGLISVLCLLISAGISGYSDAQILRQLMAPAPAAPAFGAEVYDNGAAEFSSSPTTTGNVTAAVPAGTRVVMQIILDDVTGVISGVSDTESNTYTQDAFYNGTCSNGNTFSWVYSSKITTALTTSDHLTLTWSTNINSGRFMWINITYLTGTAGAAGASDVDSSSSCGSMNSFPPPITMTGTTVAAKTIVIGGNWLNNAAWTIGTGTVYRDVAGNVHYDGFYKQLSTAGTYTPGGTTTATQSNGYWVAYK